MFSWNTDYLCCGFPGLAPDSVQKPFPLCVSLCTFLSGNLELGLLFKTVSGMSPLCYICHLFILALTKTIVPLKRHFTARAEVVKCARPLSVPDSEHWQSNNQRHVIVKYFRIIVFFLLVYCGRKSSGATCTKQAVLLPCNYYLTNWRTVINKSRACFLCVYNHMLHTYIDRSLQNIYLCA